MPQDKLTQRVIEILKEEITVNKFKFPHSVNLTILATQITKELKQDILEYKKEAEKKGWNGRVIASEEILDKLTKPYHKLSK